MSITSYHSAMNQLQAIRIFMRVVELGSFVKVAEEIDTSSSVITRHISGLEHRLNVRLLNRNTRHLSLTEIGKEYYSGCRDVVTRLDGLEIELQETSEDVSGTLRVAASRTIVNSGLARVLSGYRALHPRVHLDVTAFDARIDFVEGAFDVCLSEECRLASSILICRHIAVAKDVLVTSPTYLARRGTPATPEALGEHSFLGNPHDSPRTWMFSDESGTHRVEVRYDLTTTDTLVAREAVLNHMGIALLPASFVAEQLMRGTLISLFDRFSINGGARDVCLFYSSRENLPRKVRAFIDYAVGQYRAFGNAAALREVA
jgi:DNA-binding transcriptional LysR family regulator